MKEPAFWGVSARARAHKKNPEFDVHACFAGMNIKFPALLGTGIFRKEALNILSVWPQEFLWSIC
jgi:hypothetical protein